MGDAGAAFGSGLDFMSQRIAEQEEARQRDIDRMREDIYNEQQQKNWQTQFDYQKQLNETQMKREDNAVQRSVADHQAAGFNKLLAVGNQSASGSMTTFGGSAGGGTSQHDTVSPFSKGTQFAAMANMIMDNKVKQSMIGKSEAETALTNQKVLSEVENTAWTNIKVLREKLAKEKDEYMKKYWEKEIEEQMARIELMRRNAGLALEETRGKKNDNDISEREGLRSTDSKDPKYNTTIAAGNTIKKGVEGIIKGTEESVLNRDSSSKDYTGKAMGEWEEGIHFNSHGEQIYEVYYDKRKKKLVKVWRDGKREYKN